MKVRVTARPGAQIQRFTSAYERRGAFTRGWSVTRFYDNGEAYCDPQSVSEDGEQWCDPELGFELGAPVREEFDFDESFNDTERAELSQLAAVPAKFTIEEEYIRVTGPVDLAFVSE